MPSNVSRMQHAMTHTHGSGTFQMFQVSRAAHHGPGMSRLQLVLGTSHSENKPFISESPNTVQRADGLLFRCFR